MLTQDQIKEAVERLGSGREVLERLAPDLTEDALVVVTRRSTDPTPEPDGYRIDDERRLGGTRIIRYRKETS